MFVPHCWTVYNITVRLSHNDSKPFWHGSVYFSGVTKSLFWECQWGGGGRRSRASSGRGGKRTASQLYFSHHIYCAQSKVKWGEGVQWVAHGVNGGGGGGHAPPPIVMPLVYFTTRSWLYNIRAVFSFSLSGNPYWHYLKKLLKRLILQILYLWSINYLLQQKKLITKINK